MSNVSVFSHINDTKNPTYLSVEHTIERIKNGKSRDLVLKIRSCEGEEVNKLKMNLPCVCFSGTFKKRSKQDVILHSGFICLDFDHVDVAIVIESLKADKFIYACWVSPSGTGVKALVRVPASIEKHELYFDALKIAYPDIDKSGRDICRVCYESWDPDIYVNNTSEVWDKLVEKSSYEFTERQPVLPITREDKIIELVIKKLKEKESFVDGRNNWVLKAATRFNKFGVSEYSASSYLRGYALPGFTTGEIDKIVTNAYKYTSDHNTFYYENIEAKRSIQRDLSMGVPEKTIIERVIRDTAASEPVVTRAIEIEREKAADKVETFWSISHDPKGKIKIDLARKKFISFLIENGFRRYRLSSKYVIYIQIFDNQVSEVYNHDIKSFVFQWIDRMEDDWFDGINKHILYEFMAKGVKGFFADDLLDLLPITDLDLNEDTADTAYFYYVNGAVEVKVSGIRLINYCDLSGKVWKNQIIQRHIVLTDDYGSNTYCKFLEKICPNKEQTLALVSVIGYMLHKYKDKRISRSPIITDQQSNENPEGGSGKGLIVDGIKQIRKVITMDGKNFDTHKVFAFQRVEVDTELIFIDDLPKGFDFEKLFSIITEGIPVEKKNVGEYFIPFEKSPKLVMATNYYLRGEGSSNDRRKVDIEINNYFNARYTPFDEFGETLFTDWDNDTWNDFDNSMMFYCQYYLKSGIIAMDNESIQYKKLQANTCSEFIEFMQGVLVNTEIDRRKMFDQFVATYPGFNKIHMKTFLKWIETYCKHKGFEFNKDLRRSHNDFYIYISDPDSPVPPPPPDKPF